MRRPELHAGHRQCAAEELRLARALERLEPDPLFRRRLRSSVLNYHVALREGHMDRRRHPRRRMGAIGRSVLYASVTLTLGVGTVGAASQDSIPGDPLYGVKLRLEEIRMQIAPASVRDDLATLALAERTRELQRLVAAKDWSSTMAAAERVATAEATLLALGPMAAGTPAASHAHDVLQVVLTNAPPATRAALQRVLNTSARTVQPGSGESPPRETVGEATQKPHPTHPADPSAPPSRGSGNDGKPSKDPRQGNAQH